MDTVIPLQTHSHNKFLLPVLYIIIGVLLLLLSINFYNEFQAQQNETNHIQLLKSKIFQLQKTINKFRTKNTHPKQQINNNNNKISTLKHIKKQTSTYSMKLKSGSIINVLEKCKRELAKERLKEEKDPDYIKSLRDDTFKNIIKTYPLISKHFSNILLPKIKKVKKVKIEKWMSDSYQDKLILTSLVDPAYKEFGFYVDLGAHSPVEHSNTVLMDRNYGWKGICVDASSQYWYGLSYERSCHVVGGLLYNVTGESHLYQMDVNGLGGMMVDEKETRSFILPTISQLSSNRRKKPMLSRPIYNPEISTVRLVDILDSVEAPNVIDYLNLDVNGDEWMVMDGFNWKKYQFMIVTVSKPILKLQKAFELNGYAEIGVLGSDTFYVHRSHPKIESFLQFDLPSILSIVDKDPI